MGMDAPKLRCLTGQGLRNVEHMIKIQITKPSFDETEIEMLRACLQSGWVTQGPMVRKFEELVASRHAAKFALATTSCTAALHLAAMAIGLGEGDEAIVPGFTWVTSAHSVEYTGAKAVFCDVDLHTFNIDVDRLESLITPRTKCIVAVHLFGLSARMDDVNAVARKHNLTVIEDAACAIGTEYRGSPVGTLGALGCFSFHPRKVVTTGEGGAVTTNDSELARRISYLRNHGLTGNPPEDPTATNPWSMALFDEIGYNLRLSDIQAAVGVAQMKKLDALLHERRSRASRYTRLLSNVQDIALPAGSSPEYEGHSYQSYVIRLLDGGRERRNGIMSALMSDGIQTRPGTHAAHRLGYYAKKYNLRPEECPNSCVAEDTTITLPIFPDMQDVDQDRVIESLASSMKQSRRQRSR
jgi:perosamine synthetase